MFATQVLPETLSYENREDDNETQIVGYLIIMDKKYEVKKGETKIGRDSLMCSIAINNFSVSKIHAVIESEGIDDTFIYDVGSTNYTKLGKKVLKPHCRYKLENRSILLFGNVTAEFIQPLNEASNPNKETNKLNSGNLNPLEELGDIFELATQVTIPDTSTSKITVFEKLPETKSVFKVPKIVFPLQPEEYPKLSESVFDEVTQCRLATQNPISTSERSKIFDLTTQCQLNNPEVQETQNGNNNSEVDKVKSLLNDGQDDVLCTFMSLHSPEEQKNELLKEIKTEVEGIRDEQTQMQPVLVQEHIIQKTKVMELSNEDFSVKRLDEPIITSTPLVQRNKPNIILNQTEVSDHSSNCTQPVEEEDFIKTQEFKAEGEKSKQECEGVVNLSQDEESQPCLINLSTTEEKDSDEDFILTQAFENCARSPTVIPESEDINENEDFMATQMYDVDKEKVESEILTKGRTPSPQIPGTLDVETALDFTQRNNEDDFIETQVFDFGQNDRNLEDSDERLKDEDLIATQLVEMPVKIRQIDPNIQESRVEKSSRESSPDLLGFESVRKDSEGFSAAQLFDSSEGKMKQTDQKISSHNNIERKDCNTAQNKIPVTAESSGDETDSDLEIITDKTETKGAGKYCLKFEKTESESLNNTQPRLEDESDSNSSYIFEGAAVSPIEEVNQENVNQEQQANAKMSDSDETDCEEVAVVGSTHLVKQEPIEGVAFEETQVLTLTPPDNYQERVSESPKFENQIENEPASPDLSNAPNKSNSRVIEDGDGVSENYQTPSKIQRIEVGSTNFKENSVNKTGKDVDSPLKRPLDSKDADIVPIKKSKPDVDKLIKSSEKKFLRLVQAHDIAQIQPSRTRNSLRMSTSEDEHNKTDSPVTYKSPSSRRRSYTKRNGNISSYLTTKTSFKGGTKETFPNENKMELKPIESSSRVLRSSRRTSTSTLNAYFGPKPRRISTTKNGEYFVAFTGFVCDSLDEIITELGGKKTDDLFCCKVVVADKVRRTVKFLCAIGLGLPITSPEWLTSCKNERKFLNPWNFILKDEESEDKYNFQLKASLDRAKKVKLLEGFSVFATKNTKPPVKDLLTIVECCGGTPIVNPPNIWPKKTIIVSCLEDQQYWPLPKYRNVKVVHYEFILGGVLRQKIDLKKYSLR